LFENNKTSSNRKFLRLDNKINFPNLFWEVKKRILVKENLLDEYFNNYFVNKNQIGLISYIGKGGKIHCHIDPTLGGYDHIRFNLFLSVPQKGGLPIYNGITIPVEIGNYIKCNSSKYFHGCETVYGNIPRIVISYRIYTKNKNFYYI
jgi:hypothetical protein